MTFENKESLDAFIARFEAGGHTAAEWTHAAHVAMATVYVELYKDAAFDRIRAGIHHLNWHHGTISTATRGYHETLTYFWTLILRNHCKNQPSGATLVEKVNAAIATLPSGLFREYYSFDVVKSQQARREWIEPDLKTTG